MIVPATAAPFTSIDALTEARDLRALDDGRPVTLEFVRACIAEELARLRTQTGDAAFAAGHFERAARLIDELTAKPEFETFLTLTAYREIE